MSLTVYWTNQFKKDYEKAKARGLDIKKLDEVIIKLSNQEPLTENYRDHKLTGEYKDYRECHIQPDWLLIYYIVSDKLILVLSRTGTHSDLY